MPCSASYHILKDYHTFIKQLPQSSTTAGWRHVYDVISVVIELASRAELTANIAPDESLNIES
jgi:hypothetical protein